MYQLKREDKWGTKYYEIADKKLLSFRTPQVFSEERKQHMKGAANLQAWREAQKRMSGEESSKLWDAILNDGILIKHSRAIVGHSGKRFCLVYVIELFTEFLMAPEFFRFRQFKLEKTDSW